MELKSPKTKKKSSIDKLVSWGKMFKTPLLILFLLGSTNCEDGDVTEVPNLKIQNHVRHRHKNVTDLNLEHVTPTSTGNKIGEIKFLKRRLAKREISNFVMTDYLLDGEVENRIHYNGVTAKETYVGANGKGLKLRQLTDGRHLVQVIYSQDGDMQECVYVAQERSARNFLKTLKKELKLALNEEMYRLMNRQPSNIEEEKFFRHFRNVTFRILKHGERLPRDVSKWLDYDRLKTECIKRNEEIKYMMENRNNIAENSLARSRRSLKELFIFPGTKWCGPGQMAGQYAELGLADPEDKCCRAHDHCRFNIQSFQRKFGIFNYFPYTVSRCKCDRSYTNIARPKRDNMDLLRVPGTKWCGKGFSATRYSQLGGHSRTDRCCRMHDLRCPFWIGGMEKKYGLYNWRINTLMHCRCDERFRACLKLADTKVSNIVGNVFFNIVQTKCFILKPVKSCVRRNQRGRCLRRTYTKQAFLRDNMRY